MAGGNKKSAALIRSAYVRKCLVSNELYTLYFGNKKCETIMELPKTWFYDRFTFFIPKIQSIQLIRY